MKSHCLFFIFLVTIVCLISGCKAEKGDAGPTGPIGNANVKSFVFTVASSDWLEAGTNVIYFDKTTGLITQNVADNGTVLAYAQLPDGYWISLPNGFLQTSQTLSIDYIYKVGLISIGVGSSGLTAAQLKIGRTFKIVVIDGSASLAKINLKNYEEVKRAFNLKE